MILIQSLLHARAIHSLCMGSKSLARGLGTRIKTVTAAIFPGMENPRVHKRKMKGR